MKDLIQLTYKKQGKKKAVDPHSEDLFAMVETSAENNNNDAIIKKRLISSNDDGNNIPEKVLCCQYSYKTMPTCEIEMVILDQV